MKLSSAILCIVGVSNAAAFSSLQGRSWQSSVHVGIAARAARGNVRSALYMKSDAERVVVTGLGVISGCGIGHEDFFQACVDGKSSLGKVTRFDASAYTCQIGSEVPDDMFDPKDHFANPKNAKTNDRYTHLAVASARLTLKDAGVGDTPDTMADPDRCGVFVGTAFGGMETFERETLKLAKNPGRPKVSPFTIPALLGNTASGVIGPVEPTMTPMPACLPMPGVAASARVCRWCCSRQRRCICCPTCK